MAVICKVCLGHARCEKKKKTCCLTVDISFVVIPTLETGLLKCCSDVNPHISDYIAVIFFHAACDLHTPHTPPQPELKQLPKEIQL